MDAFEEINAKYGTVYQPINLLKSILSTPSKQKSHSTSSSRIQISLRNLIIPANFRDKSLGLCTVNAFSAPFSLAEI